MVNFLLEQSADRNITNLENVSCLHLAVDNGNSEIFKSLLKSNGCNVNSTDNNVIIEIFNCDHFYELQVIVSNKLLHSLILIFYTENSNIRFWTFSEFSMR